MSQTDVLKQILETCQSQTVKASTKTSYEELSAVFIQTMMMISGMCSGAINMNRGD